MNIFNETLLIEIDGERFKLNEPGEPGIKIFHGSDETYLFRSEEATYRIKVIDFNLQSREAILEIDGQIKQVRIIRELDQMIETMGLNANRHKKHDVMTAPMPGLVTQIKVILGEHVQQGRPLLILEAMKMENVIAAPHDAVIKEIKVTVGQAVERGLPLVEFEI
jgi:biotin carboxyl carrier protein